MRQLTHGSLFSGVGMIDYGLEKAGFKTIFQVEIDQFCTEVLKKHWPGVPRFKDVKDVGKHNLPAVDILSGGFPCVGVSGAGKRLGIGTPGNPTIHSGLWYEFRRIIGELRPPWVLIENVHRLLHTGDGDTVLGNMEEENYSCWPTVLGTRVFGAPHERKRAWILCRRDDPDRHNDAGAGMEEGDVLPPALRPVEKARQKWMGLERELASGDGGAGGAPELEAEAYAGIMRDVYGHPDWVDRFKRVGNSAVFIVPALIGSWVVQAEEKAQKIRPSM